LTAASISAENRGLAGMGARILVVDDSPTIRKLVGAILARHEHEPTLAPDGPSALDRMRRESFDLVLVDVMMPRMNGYQVCQAIRGDHDLSQAPVVLMSARADKISGDACMQAGAVDAITKPFEPRALLAVVESALKKGADEGPIMALEISEDIPVSDVHLTVSEMNRRESATTLVRGSRVKPELTAEIADRLASVLTPALTRIVPPNLAADSARIAEAVKQALDASSQELGSLLERAGAQVAEADGFSGSIDLIPLAEILQVLQLQRQTGICRLENDDVRITIWFRDGLVDVARGRGTADEFRLGRYFVEEGLLTRVGVDNILGGQAGVAKGRLGERLIQLGLITEEDLRRALIRQTSELMYEALRWRTGRFSFARTAAPSPEPVRLGLPVASIVMEGFRRVDEWRLIEESIPFGDVLLRDQVALDALGWEKLSRQEQALLQAIDGSRTVREILRAVDIGSFDACKTLYQFLQARLVRRRAA
jgi:CheY-like chemotaxis protein